MRETGSGNSPQALGGKREVLSEISYVANAQEAREHYGESEATE